MVYLTAPYNNAMRLGYGFNSFTQSVCVNDAVLGSDRKPVSERELKIESNDGEVSQIVTYTANFVTHSSEVLNHLGIKGNVSIKVAGQGGGSAEASYLNTEQMAESDINYLIQVKVINQKLVADGISQFNAIQNLASTNFTETYGDSFISGYVMGGEFYALISIKAKDTESITKIAAQLSVEIQKGPVAVSGGGAGDFAKSEAMKDSSTSISVSWSGGGQIRPAGHEGKDWTFETMRAAANGFPEKVAKYPQRTHAILTKYTALRSYHELTNKGSPLDYENAGVYTNSLADAYMEYKKLWKEIAQLLTDAQWGQKLTSKGELTEDFREYAQLAAEDYKEKYRAFNGKEPLQLPAPASSTDGKQQTDVINAQNQLMVLQQKIMEMEKKRAITEKGELYDPPMKPNELKPYPGTLLGLDKALRDCRWEMIKIVKEVDSVTNNPHVAVDSNRGWQYLNPAVFRQLIPRYSPPKPPFTQAEVDEMTSFRDKKIKEQEDTLVARQIEVDTLKAESVDLKAKAQNADQIEKDRDSIRTQYNTLSSDLKATMQRVEAKIDTPGLSKGPYCGDVEGKISAVTFFENIVKFSTPLSYSPRMIWTTSWIDAATTEDGLNYNTSVRDAGKQGFVMTRMMGNSTTWDLKASWLTLPENGIHFETGVVDTATYIRSVTGGPFPKPFINFQKPFSATPKVYVWMQGADWPDKALPRRLEVAAESVDTTKFVMAIKTWLDTTCRSARIGWVAFDASEEGSRIKVGNVHIDSLTRTPSTNLLTPISTRTAFPGAPFRTTPVMLAAWNKIDMGSGMLRLANTTSEVDKLGFTLKMSAWHDTIVYACDGFWIAME